MSHSHRTWTESASNLRFTFHHRHYYNGWCFDTELLVSQDGSPCTRVSKCALWFTSSVRLGITIPLYAHHSSPVTATQSRCNHYLHQVIYYYPYKSHLVSQVVIKIQKDGMSTAVCSTSAPRLPKYPSMIHFSIMFPARTGLVGKRMESKEVVFEHCSIYHYFIF